MRVIAFDWDGTLLDSTASIAGSVQRAFADLGLPVPTEQAARHIIGLGLQEAMAHLWPQGNPHDYQALVAQYRHHYLSRDHELTLFAGVEAGLQQLCDAGFTLSIATGKSRVGLDRALRHSGLGAYFSYSRCADETFSKPHPAMLMQTMEYFAVSSAQVVMIGDTTHDIQMAHHANTASVAVSYGAHPREQLLACHPNVMCDDFPSVVTWLKQVWQSDFPIEHHAASSGHD